MFSQQASAQIKQRIQKWKIRVAAMLFAGFTLNATAIDIDAGDYEPLDPGSAMGLLYLQYAERDEIYSQGNKLRGNNGLDSSIGIFRYVYFTEFFGMTVAPNILLPFGKLEGKDDAAGLGSTEGIGDPILAAAFWIQNNREARTFTGITPYLFVPVGQYKNDKPLNLGENRWRYSLQAAHVRPLSDKITMDLAGDVTFFGENDNYGAAKQTRKQKPLFQAQAWFRYHLTPTSDLRFLLSGTFGGETEVGGVDQRDTQRTFKFGVGGSFFVGSTQILAMAGRDIDVENGFAEEIRLNIRFLHVF